tara:strand:- start:240 stop:1322 length:1083 start_codon:yes stop_codon:yes gene_type:complete
MTAAGYIIDDSLDFIEDQQKQEAAEQAAAESGTKLSLSFPTSVAAKSATPKAFGPGSSNGSLRYPLDILDKESDYMYFEFFNYEPPFKKAANLSNALDSYNKSARGDSPATNLPKILLYMPEGVTTSYKADWTGKKFSNIAAGLLTTGAALAEADVKKAMDVFGSTAGNALGRFGDQAATSAINKLISSVTGDSITNADIFSSVGGAILNPNAELIFGGHDLRTFRVKFLMVPYNEKEAIQVDLITRSFKKAMLPKINTSNSGFFTGTAVSAGTEAAAGNHGWIGLPNLCRFTFMRGDKPHPFLTQYKMCAITDYDVSYTPDGVYASTYKGYPVATQIEIGFIETKLVYDEDIKATGASY